MSATEGRLCRVMADDDDSSFAQETPTRHAALFWPNADTRTIRSNGTALHNALIEDLAERLLVVTKELSRLAAEAQHMLDASEAAEIIVDSNLNILNFTPLAAKLSQLTVVHFGKPLADINEPIPWRANSERIRCALETGKQASFIAPTLSNREWYEVQIYPINPGPWSAREAGLVFRRMSARPQTLRRTHLH